MKGLAQAIIQNLKHYFPSYKFIDNCKIFYFKNFLTNTMFQHLFIYSYGIAELYDLCEFYGSKKKKGTSYVGPMIDIDRVKVEWPFFKLMVLNNFYRTWSDKNIWKSIFQYYAQNYENIVTFGKIIILIATNSCCCERGYLLFKNT